MPLAPSITDRWKVSGSAPNVADVAVVEVQLRERAGPLGALARRVEHVRRALDRDHRRAVALDDAQRELGAPAAEVEHERARVERHQVEDALDLRRVDRVAVVVVAVRDRAELVGVHAAGASRCSIFFTHGNSR